MRKIARYGLSEGENKISMSSTAIGVSAGAVGDKIVVWVEVDTKEHEFTDRVFFVVKDEGEISEEMALEWLGVAVMGNEDVFHIGEVL